MLPRADSQACRLRPLPQAAEEGAAACVRPGHQAQNGAPRCRAPLGPLVCVPVPVPPTGWGGMPETVAVPSCLPRRERGTAPLTTQPPHWASRLRDKLRSACTAGMRNPSPAGVRRRRRRLRCAWAVVGWRRLQRSRCGGQRTRVGAGQDGEQPAVACLPRDAAVQCHAHLGVLMRACLAPTPTPARSPSACSVLPPNAEPAGHPATRQAPEVSSRLSPVPRKAEEPALRLSFQGCRWGCTTAARPGS